jgi:hypothetical protein
VSDHSWEPVNLTGLFVISSHPQRMNTKVGNVDFILVNTTLFSRIK